ncbi:MAG: hypothetical protein R2911_01275 [Caldilineaceae bacterium]
MLALAFQPRRRTVGRRQPGSRHLLVATGPCCAARRWQQAIHLALAAAATLSLPSHSLRKQSGQITGLAFSARTVHIWPAAARTGRSAFGRQATGSHRPCFMATAMK